MFTSFCKLQPSFFTYVAGPSIVARVELSELSGDEMSTQANLTKIFTLILPAILTFDAHIRAQPIDTSLHQTICAQYITNSPKQIYTQYVTNYFKLPGELNPVENDNYRSKYMLF